MWEKQGDGGMDGGERGMRTRLEQGVPHLKSHFASDSTDLNCRT